MSVVINFPIRINYAQDMFKICPICAQDMPKIYTIYAQYMHKVCPRYAQDMAMISQAYAQDMPVTIHNISCDILLFTQPLRKF